jgi:hypothetical protein
MGILAGAEKLLRVDAATFEAWSQPAIHLNAIA